MHPLRENGHASLKMNLVIPLLFLASIALAQSPGTFTATGDMTTPRYGHTATLLPDGNVLIAGGDQGEHAGALVVFKTLSSAELYDPRTGAFTASGDMTTPRWGHKATLLPDGRVLITGGQMTNGDRTVQNPNGSLWFVTLASAEVYDPATKTFTPTGDMTMGRGGHAATLLPSGRVLITGLYVGPYTAGIATDPTPITAELYDSSNGTFTPAGNMAGLGGGATLLASGKVLITSYYSDIRIIPKSEIYDPSTGTFSLTVTQTACCESTATLLMNGNVLFAYGAASGLRGGGIAELYDPASGLFTKGNMTTAYRASHTATLLSDGKVLLAGGCDCDGTADDIFFAGAEIYDPANGTFGSTGSMQANRFLHTATLLKDGRVLMVGGVSFVGYGSRAATATLSSAELYTPAVLAGAPVLLSLSGDGKGQGAILHAGTDQVVSSSNPASVEEPVEIYLTGLTNGSVIPPQVAIGGRMAEILFVGKAPGFAGVFLNQVKVRVPSGVTPGFAVPVRLTYIGRPSNEVTIGVH